MTFDWGDAHVNLIGHSRSEVPETARGLRCEMLYPPRHPHAVRHAPERPGRHRGGARRRRVRRTRRMSESIRAFRIEPLEPLVLTGAPGTGGRSRSRGPKCDCSTSRGSVIPRTTGAWTWPPRACRSRWNSRDGRSRQGGHGRRTMELDEAEEAEVVSASVADLVEAITARPSEPDDDGQGDLHHHEPQLVGRRSDLRRHGGGPGAERGPADRPRRSRRPLAARLLPSSDAPGVAGSPLGGPRPGRPVVQHAGSREHGGGQGNLPDDLLVPCPRGR